MLERLWFYVLFPGIPLGLAWWLLSRMQRQRDEFSRLPVKPFPRPAGWSLQNRAQDLKDDLLFQLLMLLIVSLASALTYMYGSSLWAALVIGAVGSPYFLFRIKRDFPKVMNHNLGLLGEQATGRTLDELSSPSFQVYHDYECSNGEGKVWNIDHIVVSTHGIYVLETKSKRKTRNQDDGWKLSFNGTFISFPDGSETNSGLRQAARNAEFLQERLNRCNASSYDVIPIVVYPGWFINATGKGAVSVLNEQQLAKFFAGRPEVIPTAEVRALSHQVREQCLVTF